MPEEFMEQVVQLFKDTHMEYMVSILTKVAPYKSLMDYYRAQDLITGEFGDLTLNG